MKEFICSLTSGDVVVQAWGEETAPVLVCLHGWLDNMATFYPLAERLSGDYRILLVDLPGHGLSAPLPVGSHYYIWQNVETLFELLNVLELSKVSLLGHSMGGIIASLFAGTFPDKLSTLILLDSFGPFVDSVADTPKQLAKAIIDSQRTSSGLRVFDSLEKALLARKVSSPSMTDEALLPIVKRNLKKVDGGYSWMTDSRLRAQSKIRLLESQVESFFKQITVPVLVVVAKQGILPQALLEKRLAYIAHARLETVEGHHHFHAEDDGADISTAFIKHFLEN